MTMLALTLMVGIVIDDAIVVLENIYRFVEEKGMDPFDAAIEGTREIGLAVLATTLSLLAVFIPVGFMTGIVGRFMSSFGLTSAAAIAVSLIVSFTLTPMLAARWIKPHKGSKEEDMPIESENLTGSGEETAVSKTQHKQSGESKDSWFYGKIDKTLRLAFADFDEISLGRCFNLRISGGVNLPAFQYGRDGLPEDESSFQINLRCPQGTSLSATQSILDRMARDVREQLKGLSIP